MITEDHALDWIDQLKTDVARLKSELDETYEDEQITVAAQAVLTALDGLNTAMDEYEN